jgi:hypothetical protein
MSEWWWIPGSTAAEQEFSRPRRWYVRSNIFFTKTEQGWMMDFGPPSLGQLIKNRMSMSPTAKVFDTGSETLGM